MTGELVFGLTAALEPVIANVLPLQRHTGRWGQRQLGAGTKWVRTASMPCAQ